MKLNDNEILEVQSLYILKEFQNKVLGRKLLEFAFEKAKKLKYKKLIIGCLEQNPSNGFYIKMCGKFVGKRKFELPGQVLYENVYEYDCVIAEANGTI